jgi:signal transduction histidine kinase
MAAPVEAEIAETVLIVGGSWTSARELQTHLQRAGRPAVAASTTEQALARARQGGIALVVLEHHLADGCTGFDCYAALRAAGFDLPAIIVTASNDETTLIASLRSGFRDCVTKRDGYLADLPLAIERVLSEVRTTRRQAERRAQLDAQERQLQQSQKLEALSTLARNVVHELNNLLGGIKGYAELALDALSDPDERFYCIEQMLKAADQAAASTTRLLAFKRHEALQFSDVDPNRLIRNLIETISPLLGGKIRVRMQLDAEATTLNADPQRLEKMLFNFCLHARDAMPAGGELRIKTECVSDAAELLGGPCLVLTVANSGLRSRVGAELEPADCECGEAATSPAADLALATAYRVVEQHLGVICIDNGSEIGSSFRVYLPLNTLPAAAAQVDLPGSLLSV